MLGQLCSHKFPVLQMVLPKEHVLLSVLELNRSLPLLQQVISLSREVMNMLAE